VIVVISFVVAVKKRHVSISNDGILEITELTLSIEFHEVSWANFEVRIFLKDLKELDFDEVLKSLLACIDVD